MVKWKGKETNWTKWPIFLLLHFSHHYSFSYTFENRTLTSWQVIKNKFSRFKSVQNTSVVYMNAMRMSESHINVGQQLQVGPWSQLHFWHSSFFWAKSKKVLRLMVFASQRQYRRLSNVYISRNRFSRSSNHVEIEILHKLHQIWIKWPKIRVATYFIKSTVATKFL